MIQIVKIIVTGLGTIGLVGADLVNAVLNAFFIIPIIIQIIEIIKKDFLALNIDFEYIYTDPFLSLIYIIPIISLSILCIIKQYTIKYIYSKAKQYIYSIAKQYIYSKFKQYIDYINISIINISLKIIINIFKLGKSQYNSLIFIILGILVIVFILIDMNIDIHSYSMYIKIFYSLSIGILFI